MNIIQRFNLLEAIFWFTLSLFCFFLWSFKKKSNSVQKKYPLLLSLIIFIFGITDLIEIKSGAWWRPIWLLLLKSICLIGIIVVFVKWRYFRNFK